MTTVSRDRRFTRNSPCPICRGYDNQGRDSGSRCYGFLGEDSQYAHCTRSELAGAIKQNGGSSGYAHKLEGPCLCGTSHSSLQSPRTSVAQTIYDYRDASGNILYQVVRHGEKGFFQRRLSDGGWIKNLDGVERVLYHLPELNAADPYQTVFFVEGEKDADNLTEMGVEQTALGRGITSATLKRARKSLGVKRSKDGLFGGWSMRLDNDKEVTGKEEAP